MKMTSFGGTYVFPFCLNISVQTSSVPASICPANLYSSCSCCVGLYSVCVCWLPLSPRICVRPSGPLLMRATTAITTSSSIFFFPPPRSPTRFSSPIPPLAPPDTLRPRWSLMLSLILRPLSLIIYSFFSVIKLSIYINRKMPSVFCAALASSLLLCGGRLWEACTLQLCQGVNRQSRYCRYLFQCHSALFHQFGR